MLRISTCLVALLLVTGSLHSAAAQTNPRPSRMKLTMEKLKEMKAKWIANRPKLRTCKKDAKSKGLAGDDRWFFISDCMERG